MLHRNGSGEGEGESHGVWESHGQLGPVSRPLPASCLACAWHQNLGTSWARPSSSWEPHVPNLWDQELPKPKGRGAALGPAHSWVGFGFRRKHMEIDPNRRLLLLR